MTSRTQETGSKERRVWLSIVAYMIRAGVHLGLVKTEPESARSRAYIRAHDALHFLRSHLNEGRLLEVDLHRCRYLKRGKPHVLLGEHGLLSLDQDPAGRPPIDLVFDPQLVNEVQLGPEGFVEFRYHQDQLQIVVQAGDDSLGEVGVFLVRLQLALPFDGPVTDRKTPHGNRPLH